MNIALVARQIIGVVRAMNGREMVWREDRWRRGCIGEDGCHGNTSERAMRAVEVKVSLSPGAPLDVRWHGRRRVVEGSGYGTSDARQERVVECSVGWVTRKQFCQGLDWT